MNHKLNNKCKDTARNGGTVHLHLGKWRVLYSRHVQAQSQLWTKPLPETVSEDLERSDCFLNRHNM